MQQNIYHILLYSLFSLVIYYICPKKRRTIVLFIESISFYALCDIKFVLLILIEITISWFLSKKCDKKRFWSGVILVLIILCIFKYFNFFIDCFKISFANILLPLGISYYSFKIISYLADIYLGKREYETSFIKYSVYVMFFPHLICGPIVRSNTITDQIDEGLEFDAKKMGLGIVRIIHGLFMKTVIADRCSLYVNKIFSNPDGYPSLALILALCLYTIQLYCDFAGYSLIAQGLTNCFSIDCISNFKRPYLAVDIRDFWRRWHISLSSWLRDYIYIPLGGNRCSKLRKCCNVLLTFIACGIWHGSNLHFVIWGAYHGVLNNLTPKNKQYRKGIKTLMWFISMILVIFGWLLFRSESFNYTIHFLKHMISHFSLSYSSVVSTILPFTDNNTAIAYVLTLFIMIVLLFVKEIIDEYHEKKYSKLDYNCLEEYNSNYNLAWTSVFFILTILFGIVGSSNFLYANF